MPSAPDDYVHRIGRTGRAGASGIAISLVSPEEEKYLKEIEKLIKREIAKEPTFVPEKPARNGSRSDRSAEKPAARDAAAYRRPERKSSDPWFDKPYEPNDASTDKAPPPSRLSKQPKREIAALLGGLLRKE